MERKKAGAVEWLTFDLLQDLPLSHGVFLKHGGASEGSYQSLNVGYSVGDNNEDVKANIALVEECMNINNIISAKQVHGKSILPITHPHLTESPQCDALSTSITNIPLMIKHADCQVAIIYDPITHAMSVVHSGWKGSVQNIYQESIHFMRNQYGSKPENLLVCISPSLGPESSEFVNYKTEFPEHFWDFQLKNNYFDLWSISEMQLQKCGILPRHIEIMRIDTFQDRDNFFSFRRDKVTGRHGTVAVLKDK